MVSPIVRIAEMAGAGILFALVFDEWASHGIYFHAFEATLRAAGRAWTG